MFNQQQQQNLVLVLVHDSAIKSAVMSMASLLIHELYMKKQR